MINLAKITQDINDKDIKKNKLFTMFEIKTILGFLLPAIVLILWHVTTTIGIVPPYHLPTPVSVLNAAIDLYQRGQLFPHIAISTQRTLIGFVFGASIGFLIGTITGLSKISDALFSPIFAALRAVPSLAWVPMLILWLQIGEQSRVTLVAIGAFFPVYTTLVSALRNVDYQLLEMGRQFGLSNFELLKTIQLPSVIPNIVSGLRLSLAQAWLFLVAAELIASSSGLGWLLTDSQQTGRIDRIILSIVLLATLGAFTNSILGVCEKFLLRKWSND